MSESAFLRSLPPCYLNPSALPWARAIGNALDGALSQTAANKANIRELRQALANRGGGADKRIYRGNGIYVGGLDGSHNSDFSIVNAPEEGFADQSTEVQVSMGSGYIVSRTDESDATKRKSMVLSWDAKSILLSGTDAQLDGDLQQNLLEVGIDPFSHEAFLKLLDVPVTKEQVEGIGTGGGGGAGGALAAPNTPETFAASGVTWASGFDGAVTGRSHLSWPAVHEDVDGEAIPDPLYLLWRVPSSGDPVFVGATYGTGYWAEDLPPTGTYWFRIRVMRNTGELSDVLDSSILVLDPPTGTDYRRLALGTVVPPTDTTDGWVRNADDQWGDLTTDSGDLVLTSAYGGYFVRYVYDAVRLPSPIGLGPVDLTWDMMIPSAGAAGMSAGMVLSNTGDNGHFNFRIDVGSDGSTVGCRFEQDGTANIASTSPIDFTLDDWHTIRFVRHGGSAAAFVDGTLVFGTDVGPGSDFANGVSLLVYGGTDAGSVARFRNITARTTAGL